MLAAFAAALVLSAALLFSIQPMIGKQLLPRTGGTPQAWNVTLAFFQLALLAGYLCAHALGRLSIKQHGLAYLAALLAAAFFLPISLPAEWRPDTSSHIALSVLGALAGSVAVPFIALSLSAPTLQRLFSGTAHNRAADPYFLYVASNFGSLAGLLAYPFFIEPVLALPQQAEFWRYGFFGLLGLGLLCLGLQYRHAGSIPVSSPVIDDTAPNWRQRVWWVLLSFIPSSLTLGVTTHISIDLTPAPLLWVVTLGLYLISFMLAFATRGQKLRNLCMSAYPWLAAFAAASVLIHVNLPWPMVALNLAGFFTTAVACHSLLATSRPPASRLTGFYLWLSIGGALGGSFNAFLAPVIFTQLTEYPLALALGIFVTGTNAALLRNKLNIANLVTTLVILGLCSLGMYNMPDVIPVDVRNLTMIAFMATLVLLLRVDRRAVGIAALLFLTALTFKPQLNNSIFTGRNFFGLITVSDRTDIGTGYTFRLLEHGTTTHGVQMISPMRSTTPTGYYAPTGPLGLVWSIKQPKSVALVGLGAGSLNCYAKEGQSLHFIEIDPMVVDVAQKYFTFLTECPTPEITIGDGRLVLAGDSRTYDMIVLDAFSSDSIPVHIITREAIALYASRLNPGGVIALHISNRFFNLEPVLAAIAQDLGLTGYVGRNLRDGLINNVLTFPSEAVVLAQDAVSLQTLSYQAMTWRKLQPAPGISAWTDEYSNIVSSIKSNPSIDTSASSQ